MRYRENNEGGFSLVETLVAITILLIIIVGPMKISSKATKDTAFASEQIVASFLAQEGLEIAQKARDEAILGQLNTDLSNFEDKADDGWIDFLKNSGSSAKFQNCFDSKGCGLELNTGIVGSLPEGSIKRTTGQKVLSCNSGTKCRLYSDTTTANSRARYTYSSAGNTATPYTRVINFTNNGDEVKVVSKVTWSTGSRRSLQEVTAETYLYNVFGPTP